MTDKDNSPKEALQTKLFSMGQDTEKAIEAHYTAIGKIVYSHTKELSLEEVYGRDTNAIKQLAAERELIRWFEGQKNGLSMASNEVRQMIPDKDKLENTQSSENNLPIGSIIADTQRKSLTNLKPLQIKY